MYYAYASYLAVVNIVAIFSSLALLIVFWKSGEPWVRLLLLIFFSLFTVIQPLVIYMDCKKQIGVKGQEELSLTFNDRGLHIQAQGKTEQHPWKDIVSFTVRPTLVIVYTDGSHGYILSNRVLGDDRREFISYVRSRSAHKRK
ncbi:MAG: YcxB family protein [Lachnospiraceae bacterium]|nr:YcxB family protein [Lachnospiraceae bacterium]